MLPDLGYCIQKTDAFIEPLSMEDIELEINIGRKTKTIFYISI